MTQLSEAPRKMYARGHMYIYMHRQTLRDKPHTYCMLRGWLFFFRVKPGWTKTSSPHHNTARNSSYSSHSLSSRKRHGVKVLYLPKSHASTSPAPWLPDSSAAPCLVVKGPVSEQTAVAIAVSATCASPTCVLLSIRVTRYEKNQFLLLFPSTQHSLCYSLSRYSAKRGLGEQTLDDAAYESQIAAEIDRLRSRINDAAVC